jgi:CheY-like chemotaxis protein
VLRILVVDDEVDMVRQIAGHLEAFPAELEVVTATNGEQGLQVLRTSHPEVLLTDIRMEGVHGIELVFRALQVNPALVVVVMTAFDQVELRPLAGRAGAVRFIGKPIVVGDLRSMLLEASETLVRRTGIVGGLDVWEVALFMALAADTKGVRLQFGQERGTLVFEGGQITYAATRKLQGLPAFLQMAGWGEGLLEEMFDADPRRYHANLSIPLSQLLEHRIDKPVPVVEAEEVFSVEEPSATDEPAPREIADVASDDESDATPEEIDYEERNGGRGMNINKMKQSVEVLKDDLGLGLLAADVFDASGLSYAGYNEQPAASALFADMTQKLRKTLEGAGFPSLGRYYLLELEDRKMVIVALVKELQWGMLVDGTKVNLGVLLNVALPKAIENLKGSL